MPRPRALAIALVLSIVTLVGGIELPIDGYTSFRYAPFGLVSGLLGALYAYTLADRGVIVSDRGWIGVVLAAYWVVATATVFQVVLPSAGLIQVGLATLTALAAVGVARRPNRQSAARTFGPVIVILAGLSFGSGSLMGAGPGLHNVFVAYAPRRPAQYALDLAALAGYGVALYLLRPAHIALDRIGDRE